MLLRRAMSIAVVVLLIAGAVAAWQYNKMRQLDRETSRAESLRSALNEIRGAIERFESENGRRPDSLDELVPRYLTEIPVDPITGSASTWRVVTEETVRPSSDFGPDGGSDTETRVMAVHSGAGPPWSEF